MKQEIRENKSKSMKQETSKTNLREQRGITLVALVITIVLNIIIIIILATVAISFAFGNNGLINRAEDARDMYANDTAYTEGSIANVESYINGILLGTGSGTKPGNPDDNPDVPPTPEEPPKVEEIKGGEAFDDKTTVEDAKGNKIVVPGGFKIASDSGNTVQQGIVIEDVSASTDTAVQGSQFVWIPVGVFTKDDGTPSNEIILGRYTFATSSPGTPTLQQAAYTKNEDGSYTDNYITPKVIATYYSELATYREGVASQGKDGLNTTAKDLKAWIDSVKENGGYYIGRYEASFASGTSVDNYKAATKSSARNSESSMSYTQGTLWNFITQVDASEVAINTYLDSTSVKSDLINSYAWDTAIVFIQECENTNYANQDGSLINTNLSNTGTGQDEVCKINDMASNIVEFTTEYSNSKSVNNAIAYSCTSRGGYYKSSGYYTSRRTRSNASYKNYSFRIPPYAVLRCLKSMFYYSLYIRCYMDYVRLYAFFASILYLPFFNLSYDVN